MVRVHVAATGHSLNYLPEYIAEKRGFFKDQGIEISASVPKPWDLVLDRLEDGTADAALGGIWVPSMYRDRAKEYTVFAQLSNRSPLALVQRGPAGSFKMSDLPGKTVLMRSGNGASVGLFFKMLLKENGIDPKSVEYVQDLDGIMLAKLFQGGMGDYFLTDNVSALVMEQKNPDVSVAMEMVRDGDEIPWSVYYRETATTTPEVLDVQRRFCVALGQGMDWIMNNDATKYKDELSELFPAAPVEILVELTNKYRQYGMWSSPLVSRYGYERWQKGIAYGRLIQEPFPYETIVDEGPAVAAAASISPEASTQKGSGKDQVGNVTVTPLNAVS